MVEQRMWKDLGKQLTHNGSIWNNNHISLCWLVYYNVNIWRFDSLSNGNAMKTKHLFSFSFHFNLKNKLMIGNSDQISSLEACNIFWWHRNLFKWNSSEHHNKFQQQEISFTHESLCFFSTHSGAFSLEIFGTTLLAPPISM